MTDRPVDKELYRTIIEDYFRAFGTHDFSNVQFGSRIEFLSPISGTTLKGRKAVLDFVGGVSTRVVKVNILATSVDYPTASGVWQMTTTKGVTYTLHNFFRLDEEGLLYIWPMFDPKAVMENPAGLLQWLRGEGYYEVAARTPKQPTGVTISRRDRIFVNFPRHSDPPDPSVGEIGADGALRPYPNQDWNQWDGEPGESAATHFVCIHTVHADRDDFLWVLDPASPAHRGVVPGGAKLVKINLLNDMVERVYPFGEDVAPAGSYLNKIGFAHGRAFISDSDLGAIIVLNLETGHSRRLLSDHISTKVEAGVEVVIDGQRVDLPPVHADGLAVDPGLNYVYYKSLVGSTIYRVPTAALIDESLSADELGNLVETVAVSEPTGGITFDDQGNLYLTAVQENAIKVLRPDGRIEFFARATNFLWPDTITISRDGHLLFTASQLHLMPVYNGGVERRHPPYNIFRIKI